VAASVRAWCKQWPSQPLLLRSFVMRALFIRTVPVAIVYDPTASIPNVSVLAIVTPAVEKPSQKNL
jgi:hypothetical protein